MKNILYLFIFSFFVQSYSQSSETAKNGELYKNAPDWAKLMYSENPNVNEVDRLYLEYFKKNKYTKSTNTQYYKRWRRTVNPYLNNEGFVDGAKKIGALARPDDILFSADLPKTRSGKIMRRLLRDIAEGRALGDTTTLADPNVVASLKDQYEDKEG